jgi:serine phosphatase RsbU (regulator of sigma subunit)/AAA+ ATPase superfamily predicted ATPase
MGKKWPHMLSLFHEELDYTVREGKPSMGYQLFYIDLSSWKLRLSNRTPVIWVKKNDLESASTQHVIESLADVLRERNLTRKVVLVLFEGDSAPFFRYKNALNYNLVLIGVKEHKVIVYSRRPSGELLDLISAQVPISYLSPYETRAPVTGSRFFGREHEISRILANPDTNHAILGIRRIGKTSLLRETERLLIEREAAAQIVYLECSDLLSTDDYIREVVRKLNPRELPRLEMQKYVFFFPNFLERMSKYLKSKIIFLLDEVDNLVIMQRGDWELFRMLRSSSNKGACQYIIAGFREAMQEQYLLDSPFYNFAQEIRLSEFTRQQAYQLIVTPMENLRVRFRNRDEVVNRIYEETAGHPNLIQYYCLILLRHLDQSGEREISPDSLIDIYSDEGFTSHLLTSFMQNTENREKALIYAILMVAADGGVKGFGQEEIDTVLRKKGISLPQKSIDEACNVLTLAGVIHRKEREYYFTSPVFTKVLQQTYDLKTLDGPTTARYHRQAVEQITQCVEERVYCAVLGPRLSGKTLLLRYIEKNMAKLLGWTCIYLDLSEIRTTTQGAFFADLTRQTAEGLMELTGSSPSLPIDTLASSAVFRGFLAEYLETAERDLVLLIDPLEALPTDLVQALLTSLRAAYMDQQTMENQVTVVISGALSLATLTVGESSPFRGIARRVFIGDLSESESQTLIDEFLVKDGISATRPSVNRLLGATSGDIFLIRRISERCAEIVRSRTEGRLRSQDVTRITRRFLREEVTQYAPLLEAVRLIEEDPDLLQCILRLLEVDDLPRSALPLPLSPDLDPLYLTGVVEKVDGDRYRIQNAIYRQFLAGHFTPDRVGHVLTMAGQWDSAIDYLEASILRGSSESRSDLLPATINSIYAAEDLTQAVYFLRRGLSAAFGVSESQVWFHPQQEPRLRLIGSMEVHVGGEAWNDSQIMIEEDRLEARAYRFQVQLRDKERQGRILRAIPLSIPGRPPIGVVTINEETDDPLNDRRERDFQLVGFLNQAARALQTVSARRQELTLANRVQTSLLPEMPPEINGWGFAATWRPARETSGDFYDFIPLPDGRIGILIADVVDKGMGAALLMTLTRTLMRTYATQYPDQPDELLRVTNARILADIEAGLFVTTFYGVLNPETGVLTYAGAGHPPPYLFTLGGGKYPQPLPRTGMALGVTEETEWTSASLEISPGSTLLLYTDGILDTQDPSGAFFDEGEMLEAVGSVVGREAREIQETLLSRVFAFAGAERQVDDITLVVVTRE